MCSTIELRPYREHVRDYCARNSVNFDEHEAFWDGMHEMLACIYVECFIFNVVHDVKHEDDFMNEFMNFPFSRDEVFGEGFDEQIQRLLAEWRLNESNARALGSFFAEVIASTHAIAAHFVPACIRMADLRRYIKFLEAEIEYSRLQLQDACSGRAVQLHN